MSMDTITRKSLLYRTNVEYGDWAVNHVEGCAHGCSYCYALSIAKRSGRVKTMEDWCKPKLVINAPELLKKELIVRDESIYRNDETIQLCFTTDPFMVGYPEVQDMSIELLKEITDHHVTARVLTKGVYPDPDEADMPRFAYHPLKTRRHEYGITVTHDPNCHVHPRGIDGDGTATTAARIASLKRLHDAGYYTWVSIEPYPTPYIAGADIEERMAMGRGDDMARLLEQVSFVNKVVFGRMNYNAKVTEYLKGDPDYYNRCAKLVEDFCAKNEIECYIKNGTVTQ